MFCEWRTKDGRYLPIGVMTDDHVMNCIRYINRVGIIGRWNESRFTPREWVLIFGAEMVRRNRARQ